MRTCVPSAPCDVPHRCCPAWAIILSLMRGDGGHIRWLRACRAEERRCIHPSSSTAVGASRHHRAASVGEVSYELAMVAKRAARS